MRAVVKQVTDRHYADWCDEPIPALDGKTPREAVQTAFGRIEVVELLKDYENSNARLPPQQQYDYGWMWDALGLERDAAMEDVLEPYDDETVAARRALVLEILDKQIADNDPPETRQTRERLLKAGYAEDEAMKLIGCALISEMNDIVRDHRQYDHDGYVRMLHKLPKLPWDDEEQPSR
jgi:hypothetical protein